MLQIRYSVTAARPEISLICLKAFSFNLLCNVEFMYAVLSNFYIVPGDALG